MEEKGFGPLVFIAGMLTAAGIFKANKLIQPSLKKIRVFFIEKKEHLEDLVARSKAKKLKAKAHLK